MEERDLEERDLTKLVGALAEVSSSVGCAVGQHNLADDRSELEVKDTYLFFKVMESRTSGRRFERTLTFDQVKIALRRLFCLLEKGALQAWPVSIDDASSRLVLILGMSIPFSPTLPPWVSCRSKLQQGKFSFGLH